MFLHGERERGKVAGAPPRVRAGRHKKDNGSTGRDMGFGNGKEMRRSG